MEMKVPSPAAVGLQQMCQPPALSLLWWAIPSIARPHHRPSHTVPAKVGHPLHCLSPRLVLHCPC